MTVESILDRVQIIRVFDVHGLVEVVEELTQGYKTREQERKREKALKKSVIGDSQEDSDNGSLEEPRSEGKEGEEIEDHRDIGVVVIDTIDQSLSEIRNTESEDLEKEDDWAEMDKPEGIFSLLGVLHCLTDH